MRDKGSILVVDDTVDSLKVLTETLKAEGYQVFPANSGELALAWLAAKMPELILLDIRMPGMDGFEVCRRLKTLEYSHNIPVIFLSALADVGDRVEGLKLGAVDFISKPFRKEELLARVETHLELARLRAGLERRVAERTAELNRANERLQVELDEHRRTLRSLRDSQARLQLALEAAGAGLWVMEPDGSSVWASVRTRELFHFTADQSLSYKDLVERIHSKDRTHLDLAVREAGQTKQPYLVEFRLALPDEQVRWIAARGKWQGEAGGHRRMMGIFIDVTKHKQAEEVQRSHDRMHVELDIAHRVQKDLLPKKPLTIPGYTFAGWSMPATEMGGDYFDWLMLPDGRAVVTIADATGHGIGAALLVTACRAYFRVAAHVDNAIENTMTRVNDLIADDVPEGTFITAAIAALDPGNNLLKVYSAGHGPIFYYHAAESRVLEWGGDSLPLGMVRSVSASPSRTLAMEPGDIFLLITDGFFEWVDPEEQPYAIERLRRFLKQHHRSAPESLIRGLYEDVLAFTRGTPQKDDLTAVIIKRDRPVGLQRSPHK